MVSGRNRLLILLLTAILALSAVSPGLVRQVYASATTLDQIRVALFIFQRDIVPTVTLSHSKIANIGIRTPEGVRNWLPVVDGKPFRISLDQYRLLAMETFDVNQARSLYANIGLLLDAREQAYIFGVEKQGAIMYQVMVGNYTTVAEANAAKERLLKNGQLATQLNGHTPVVKGPHHLSAGTYATEQEAKDQSRILANAGVESHIVFHENAEKQLVYSVWIGEESTAEQLVSLQSAISQSVPSVPLQPVSANVPFLLKRNDYSAGNSSTVHYFFNAVDQKVWFSAAEPGIQVHERFGRTYRGSIEISQYSGKLTVINDLPFEQYLYGVVSKEMGTGWPSEALKAQAVAARTFALRQGVKYNIAHISDTTFDQAYGGFSSESPDVIAAVDATASEVIMHQSGMITPFYSSNAGGFTAESYEVWGTQVDYLKSVPSPDDIAQKNRLDWHRVVLSNGIVGYIRSDFARPAGIVNPVGLLVYEAIDDNINIRPSPYVENTVNAAIAQVKIGERFTVLETVKESNAYSWIRGPWTPGYLFSTINRSAKNPLASNVLSLEVSKRGPSGRVLEVEANGQAIQLTSPDSLRSALGGLSSTRFDIDQLNRYTISGAGGTVKQSPQSKDALYVLSGKSGSNGPQPLTQANFFILNGGGDVRVASQDTLFRFVGVGFGHGLGMSQWGARALAELGYDYKKILLYYYNDVNVIKG